MLTLVKKLMTKILNLKLVILLEYQNIKTFLKKKFVPNWSEKVFVIKKVENTAPWTYGISDPKEDKIVETFYKKKLQLTNQKTLELKTNKEKM